MMEAYKAQYPDCYKAYQEAFAKGHAGRRGH